MIKNDYFYKLEMIILSILSQDDYTCDQIQTIIQKHSHDMIHIKAGTVLTSLFYFEEANLISQTRFAHTTYYHIENSGRVRLDTLKRNYHNIVHSIDDLLNYQKEGVDSYE
ncbi:MAG: hypothetical protein ACLUVC_13465 [Longibaculum sp.]